MSVCECVYFVDKTVPRSELNLKEKCPFRDKVKMNNNEIHTAQIIVSLKFSVTIYNRFHLLTPDSHSADANYLQPHCI